MGRSDQWSLTPGRVLLGSAAIVMLSTVFLPWSGGNETVLGQDLMFSAYALAIRYIPPGDYAFFNHPLIWIFGLVLNLLCFLIPAGLLYWIARRRWPRVSQTTLMVWCAFYLCSLFVLFPAPRTM